MATDIDRVKRLVVVPNSTEGAANISFTTSYGLAVSFNPTDAQISLTLIEDQPATTQADADADAVGSSEDNTPLAGVPSPASRPESPTRPTGASSQTESEDVPTPAPTRSHPNNSGLRYKITPDYCCPSLSYTPAWPDNPAFEVSSGLETHELKDKFPGVAPWIAAFNAWLRRYCEAFEAQECHMGSGAEPFPDLEERNVFVVEGALLVAWLSLQAGVDRVSYDPEDEERYEFELGEDGAARALGRVIKGLKWEEEEAKDEE
ncbi:hypothetical protein CcaCcLH18_08060 [Colletotrichum camelliae]|nr:hypothetical protein CcaCcLH18_08060 [Colletotrichum camelliae]